MRLDKRYITDQKVRIKPPKGSHQITRTASGAFVVPVGKHVTCPNGLHKWRNKIVFGVPFLTCSRCGYRAPKPTIEKTSSKREMIKVTQREMAKRVHNTLHNPLPLSKYPDVAREKQIDDRRKRMDQLIERVWERSQRKRNDRQEPENRGW